MVTKISGNSKSNPGITSVFFTMKVVQEGKDYLSATGTLRPTRNQRTGESTESKLRLPLMSLDYRQSFCPFTMYQMLLFPARTSFLNYIRGFEFAASNSKSSVKIQYLIPSTPR